jgi:hypothetical protein
MATATVTPVKTQPKVATVSDKTASVASTISASSRASASCFEPTCKTIAFEVMYDVQFPDLFDKRKAIQFPVKNAIDNKSPKKKNEKLSPRPNVNVEKFVGQLYSKIRDDALELHQQWNLPGRFEDTVTEALHAVGNGATVKSSFFKLFDVAPLRDPKNVLNAPSFMMAIVVAQNMCASLARQTRASLVSLCRVGLTDRSFLTCLSVGWYLTSWE